MSKGTPPLMAPYRELTFAAVALGVVLGAIMTAAFVYICLKLGFGMPGSTVAAILGFAVLRGVMGKGSIVENNINQTVASGVNAASSGVAFTLPALFLLKANQPELGIGDIDPLPFILAGIGGAFLGVVLIVPLRKQMLEYERLRFPSGIAVATLLKSPGAGARQAMLLMGGFLVATFFTVAADNDIHLIPHRFDIGSMFGAPAYIPIAIGVTFASLGAGLLSGKGGMPFFLGALLAWWVISPIAVNAGWVPDTGFPLADQENWLTWEVIFSEMLRPLGIGVLIGGALAGVIAAFPALKSALKSLSQATKLRGVGGGPGDEMPSNVLYLGLSAAVMILFAAAMVSTDAMSVGEGIAVAIVGTLWLAVAGLIVAQATGMTDISPLSGMSLIGVTIMFFLTAGNITASITLGVAICIGIGQCGDMMTDLKAGHLIGAVPRKQQLSQLVVGWIGVPIAVGAVFLFWESPGFGPGQELTAPQGQALEAVIASLSSGDVPLDKYIGGAAIGAGLGAFPISGLGVLVGLAMYLPFYITATYGIGCIASIALRNRYGAQWFGETLVPVAAGFIIGEALPALVIAVVKATA